MRIPTPHGEVDGALIMPAQARVLMVFAHGAGAGFAHHNMQSIAQAWAHCGIASLRYNFPFTQAGRRRVDSKAVTLDTIEAALKYARDCARVDAQDSSSAHVDLPLFLAGHSYGGRMNSHLVVERESDMTREIQGLVFCSFPLHPSKKPSVERAAHLDQIQLPMQFISGTRDDLADLKLLQTTIDSLKNAQLHTLETANHSYAILKRTRTNPQDVFDELAGVTDQFVSSVLDG